MNDVFFNYFRVTLLQLNRQIKNNNSVLYFTHSSSLRIRKYLSYFILTIFKDVKLLTQF